MQDAPFQQQMSRATLRTSPGLVIRQKALIGNFVACPCYAPSEVFGAWELPNRIHAAKDHDGDAWIPEEGFFGSGEFLKIKEESSCCARSCLSFIGALHRRPLTLNVFERGQQVARAERPFRLGGALCCPVRMDVYRGRRKVGRVVEDFDCYPQACVRVACQQVHVYKVVTKDGGHVFSLRTSLLCCGRVNNTCGATVCFPTLIMDVVSPSGQLRSTVQKTFEGGLSSIVRAAANVDTYVADFPEGSSEDEKLLITLAIIGQDYMLFARRGGESRSR